MPSLLRCSFVFLPLFAVSTNAAQVEARGLFERLSDSGPRGVVELALDPEAYARATVLLARGTSFELDGLALPGGLELAATLRPVSAMAAGAQAQVIGEDGAVSWVLEGC